MTAVVAAVAVTDTVAAVAAAIGSALVIDYDRSDSNSCSEML